MVEPQIKTWELLTENPEKCLPHVVRVEGRQREEFKASEGILALEVKTEYMHDHFFSTF